MVDWRVVNLSRLRTAGSIPALPIIDTSSRKALRSVLSRPRLGFDSSRGFHLS